MNKTETILMIIAFTASTIEALFDAVKTNKGKKIEHTISAGVRVLLVFLVSTLFIDSVPHRFTFMVILLFVYWIPFDLAFNIFASRPSYLLGKTALTDRIARKLGADLHGWTALKCVVLSALCIIYKYL